MTRQLIVNADDFGETPATTRGILDCFRAGTVRSTSVIVTSEYWREAAAVIRDTPDLDYGIHLNLTSGRPCLPRDRMRMFLDPGGTFPTRDHMIGRLLRHPRHAGVIQAELREQVRRLAETGVPLTHLNFHEHLFFIPWLWRVCLAIKEEFAIPFIRRPYQPRSARSSFSTQSLKRIFLNLWFRRRKLPGAIESNFADSLGSKDLREVYPVILRHCGPVGELVVHPGIADPSSRDDLDVFRSREHEFLTSGELHDLARREEVRLIGYRDLLTTAHDAS